MREKRQETDSLRERLIDETIEKDTSDGRYRKVDDWNVRWLLSQAELFVYFVVYVGVLASAIWEIFKLSNDKLIGYYGLSPGWWFLDRKKDDYDFEWPGWQLYFQQNAKFFLLHVVAVKVNAAFSPRFLKPAHIFSIIGAVCIYSSYGALPLVVLVVKNCLFYTATLTRRKWAVWLMAMFWVCVINFCKPNTLDEPIETYTLTQDQFFELLTIGNWNLLKCISFSIDRVNAAGQKTKYRLVNLFAYSFYFPTLYFGPFFVYDRFQPVLTSDRQSFRLADRVWRLGKELAVCAVWYWFTEFALHFLYVCLLQQNEAIVERSNSFAFYGFGYLMGQFFHLKYICAYGFGIALGTFDGVRMPARPICIGIVHLYSDMWKHFDEGLYEFLFKYIYTHLCHRTSGALRKLAGSFMTFFFIYVWHGQWAFILIWAVANFVCIVLEYTLKRFYSGGWYQRWVVNRCSRAFDRRLRAIIGSHVLIPSVLSNFFYFAGIEIGMLFVRRTYMSSWSGYFGIYSVCYCFYNIGDWFKRRKGENKEKFSR